MKKKLMMMAAAVAAAFGAWADTETVGGYTWTCRINGETAEIYKNRGDGSGTTAISPSPTGAVTIPSTLGGKPVTSIGSWAFYNCNGLTSVTIPNSVTSIGACAFYDCRKIVSVMIPDSVTSIGDWAFRDCRGLVSVTIPGSVASIGDAAFYECSALTSVTICNGVTNIGGSAFEYCSRLVDVTIPDSVTSIGYGAFYKTPFYDGQPNGLVVFGRVAYEMRGNCPRSVVIPDGIVSIGTDAFYDCYGLSSVAMPDSLTSIGDFAFFGCKNLVDVTIPDSVASIGDCAFECSGLMSVTIGKGVESIGNAAFWKCSQLENVSFPDSLTSIGESAFSFCSGLKSVTIPNNVANIGECVFQCCDGLTNVVIETGVESIGGGAFSGCSGLTSVTIPDSVTSIGYFAFSGCSGLTSVTIPNSVTNIGTMAFSGCRGLADADGFVVVQDVLYDYVGSNREVTIPDGVSFIDDESFYDCGGLTSVTIPGSVTSIDNGAFYGCSKLTRIMVDASNPYFSSANGLLLSKDGKELILGVNGDVVIPDGVKSIDYGAFEYRSGLTSVTIPDSVTNIGDFAFFGCENLKSVTIPASVMNIGNQAFDNCSKLETVRFLGDAPIVGRQCFDSVNPSCTAYVREDSTGWGGDMWNGLSIEYTYVERAKIDFRAGGGSGSMETVYVDVDGITYYTLPACRFSRSGYSFVGWRVYDPCGFFDALFSPSGVPYELCGGDYTLTAMWSQDGNPALSIEDGVLLLVYPNGHSSVSIPDGVTSIGDGAFYGCGGLTSVTIPDSVTNIGDFAFFGCNKLTRIMVDASNPYFSSANGLLLSKDGKKLILGVNGDVVIPDGVTSIGEYAFSDCSGLVSVMIPESVKDIGTGAFSGCGNMKSVMFDGDAPNIGSWAFEDVGDGCTMYVRKGSTGWGVGVPGTWNGLSIAYADELTEKCIVTFDVNGSGALRDEEVTRKVVKNAAVGELPIPMVPNLANSGFGEFLGWFTAKTGGAQIAADTIVTKDVTYYAHWKYFRYIVLDANGGEFSEEYDNWWPFVENGATLGSLPVVSRSGYSFDGWFTAASGGTRVSADTKITATASNIREPVKYYAHWTADVSFPDVTTWKFYEEADDDEGLNLAAWEEWNEKDVPFWMGSGINMAIPVNGNLSASDIVLVAGTYSGYGTPQVVSDEWMFAKHCTALEQAIGYDPYEDDEYDQGAYGPVFEDDVRGRNYSLSMDIWPEKKVVSGRKWILLEIGGRPARGCKTFYVGLKGRDDVGYSRFRIYATPDQGVSQRPSDWSSQRELAVLPIPIGGGTTSGCGMYASGTRVSLSANPNAGYEFDGWYDQSNGQLLGTSVSIAYVTTGGDKTVFAKFRQKSAPTPTPEPTPDSEEPPALFESVDGVAPLAAASEYDGCLYDVNGVVAGTIQVKVGKPNKNTGLASVKATLQLAGQKKLTLKAVEKGKAQIASDGPTMVSLAGGEPCEVTLGAEGLSGTYGQYAIDGARNLFASKDKSEQSAANNLLEPWLGAFAAVWYGGSVSVSIAKKGKAKAAVTLSDGTKATANAQLLVGEEWLCVPVVVAKKANIAFTLWLPRGGGEVVVEGLPNGAVAGKAGALKSGAAFKFDASALASALGDATYAAQLPDGLSVEQDGKKWIVAGGAKAGKVQLAKGAASPADIDVTKAGANPSALKLTYKAKDGTFKGTFKAYTLVKGKPKATTVNVSGILVGDKGYGTLSVKKTSVSAPVEIR